MHSTDLLYMPRYENPVCLGAKCRMREWKASREKVWCCGDSCLTFFSKDVFVCFPVLLLPLSLQRPRYVGRQTHRQTNRQIERYIDRQIFVFNGNTHEIILHRNYRACIILHTVYCTWFQPLFITLIPLQRGMSATGKGRGVMVVDVLDMIDQASPFGLHHSWVAIWG